MNPILFTSKKISTEGVMSSFIPKVILLCVLTLLSMHNILGKTQVNIVNSLEGNLDLNVHCKLEYIQIRAV
jgi:hypothetical protein